MISTLKFRDKTERDPMAFLLELPDEIFGDDLVDFSVGVFLPLLLLGEGILNDGEFAQFSVHSLLSQRVDKLI